MNKAFQSLHFWTKIWKTIKNTILNFFFFFFDAKTVFYDLSCVTVNVGTISILTACGSKKAKRNENGKNIFEYLASKTAVHLVTFKNTFLTFKNTKQEHN